MTAESRHLRHMQKMHQHLVLRRREDVLAATIARMLPDGVETGLDVGCGDGVIAAAVMARRPHLTVEGVEVLERETCQIQYRLFDGKRLPFPDDHFDFVEIVDVLHHTENIEQLVGECARVSRRHVVIKDHLWAHRFDVMVLRFMDWVGNRSYGVNLVYNYQRQDQWMEILDGARLTIRDWQEDIGLYPSPFNLVFERGKHFVALLEKTEAQQPNEPSREEAAG